MDIPFKPIRLEDKEIITSFTFPSDYRNCDFSFANMCSWRFLYDSEFAIVDGYLLIRFMIEDKSRFAYMMPVGDGDLAGAIRSVCWVSPPTPRSNWKAHFPEAFSISRSGIISTIFIYGRI